MAIGGKAAPRGKAASPFKEIKRQDFFDIVKEFGLELEVTRYDKGYWNERREFRVNGFLVESAIKNNKPDWEAMYHEVLRIFKPEA